MRGNIAASVNRVKRELNFCRDFSQERTKNRWRSSIVKVFKPLFSCVSLAFLAGRPAIRPV